MRALIISVACVIIAAAITAALWRRWMGQDELPPRPDPDPPAGEDDAGAEAEQDEQWADELGQMNAERDADSEQAALATAAHLERIALEADLIAMELLGCGDSEALLQGIRASEQRWDAYLASGV